MIRKISVQDIVPKHSDTGDSSRRERDFLIERLTRKHVPTAISKPLAKPVKRPPHNRKGFNFKSFKFGNKWIWMSLPLILAFIIFIILQFTASATVSIKPKQQNIAVDSKLIASLDASSSPSAVLYQIITLNAEDTETVLASGTTTAKSQKASGQITIFNNSGTAPQTLIKNTRFETTDGLVYRIQDNINVPGTTIVDGKSVPGSVTTKVVADQVGSKYNIDMADFTVPGFKTDVRRYKEIFARSKTAMTGGSDGNSLGVSENARHTAQTAIETRLKDSLSKQVQSQKTANSVIFDSASKITFQHLPDTTGSDTQHVVIHEQGTISSVVFDKKMLGKLLLSDAITAVGNNAEVHGLESLHFIAAVSSTSPTWQPKPFAFTLNGSVDVTGVVDTDKLLQDVRGISRNDLTKVLSNFPTIDKANVMIRPFWKSAFPNSASSIKIEIVK